MLERISRQITEFSISVLLAHLASISIQVESTENAKSSRRFMKQGRSHPAAGLVSLHVIALPHRSTFDGFPAKRRSTWRGIAPVSTAARIRTHGLSERAFVVLAPTTPADIENRFPLTYGLPKIPLARMPLQDADTYSTRTHKARPAPHSTVDSGIIAARKRIENGFIHKLNPQTDRYRGATLSLNSRS